MSDYYRQCFPQTEMDDRCQAMNFQIQFWPSVQLIDSSNVFLLFVLLGVVIRFESSKITQSLRLLEKKPV